jgi:hypothetical protein
MPAPRRKATASERLPNSPRFNQLVEGRHSSISQTQLWGQTKVRRSFDLARSLRELEFDGRTSLGVLSEAS